VRRKRGPGEATGDRDTGRLFQLLLCHSISSQKEKEENEYEEKRDSNLRERERRWDR